MKKTKRNAQQKRSRQKAQDDSLQFTFEQFLEPSLKLQGRRDKQVSTKGKDLNALIDSLIFKKKTKK